MFEALKHNFAIDGMPPRFPFHIAHCSNLMLFGIVSKGLIADSRRLDAMPSLEVKAPAFVQSVDDAAEFFAGMLRAEIGVEALDALRKEFAAAPDEFAPHEITVPGDRWKAEVLFGHTFSYATGGRDWVQGVSAEDDAFMASVWEVFAEQFFAAVEA